MLQFKRLANVYFLVIAILLSIKIISPINPLTAWAPLIIVIGISMMREGNPKIMQATKIISAINPIVSLTTRSELRSSGTAN